MDRARMTPPPPPLTPEDCDLRDFQFMPLDVVRFAQSDLVAMGEPEEIVAAILLWGASWHQVPAASLTDDDRTLARLAGYGRGGTEWARVRAGALRGWIKCSDGRLYHPVVAEKAREAFKGKLAQRHRTYQAAIRKHNERNAYDQRRAPTFEEWLDHGRPTSVVRDAPKAPEQPRLDLEGEQMSRVTTDDVTHDKGGMSRECHAQNQSKGQGQGQGEGQGDSITNYPAPEIEAEPATDWDALDLLAATQQLCDLAGVSLIMPAKLPPQMDVVKDWRRRKISLTDVVAPIIERARLNNPDQPVYSLAYFDTAIATTLSRSGSRKRAGIDDRPRAPAKPPEPEAPALTVEDQDDAEGHLWQIRKVLKPNTGYDQHLRSGQAAMSINGVGLVVTCRSEKLAAQVREKFGSDIAKAAKQVLGSPAYEVRSQ